MDIFEKVKEMIVEQLGVDEVDVKKETAFKDLNADSLDIVELVMTMEEEFDLEISDEQVEKIKTVGDVIQYLEANV